MVILEQSMKHSMDTRMSELVSSISQSLKLSVEAGIRSAMSARDSAEAPVAHESSSSSGNATGASSSSAPTVKGHASSRRYKGDDDMADDEMDMMPDNTRLPTNHRQRKRKAPEENTFKDCIRTHALRLMKRDTHKSPFANIPSAEQIAAFDPSSGRECCSADNFSYDIHARPSSAWNLSTARVFAADFKAQYPRIEKSEDEVKQAWMAHTDTLRRQYRDQAIAQSEALYEQKRHRQQERKRQLFQRRRNVSVSLLSTRATELVDALGVHGMSTDESDHEAGRGEATYFIRSKTWRSAELQTWLRTLDSLHLWTRYRGGFKASQGGWPHFRVASQHPCTRPPIVGLPTNCYAPSLLQRYDTFKLKWLSPLPNNIDLKHPDPIIETARLYDLAHKVLVTGHFDPERPGRENTPGADARTQQ
ncbi:uncharacterized protein B0H18DRAFT_125338 [Fomitopsis serialis]|uniref:uncharacterized protein n=1 Tax=Fomitopsis serialis TaxID=139415 RepID=UPI00200877BF|nr:uncharacterized protein B0H18DRAFT_125338 [Neoantrodia serialis]KAH9914566.1 hypothetical protein B0H18DRAFT_125338 [Neoantrodia serialis]